MEWTLELFVDRMNATFGQLLRKELAKLSHEVITAAVVNPRVQEFQLETATL